MKRNFRASIVLLLITVTGCATAHFRVTSEPPGASVSVRETPLLYPLWSDPQWVQKGTTPCTVVTTKTSWRPRYPPLAFRVSLNTNLTRTIELEPSARFFNVGFGQYLLVGGPLSIALAPLAAAEGGSMAFYVILGVGTTVAGFEMCDHGFYYPQKDIHVDFNSVDPNPNPSEVPSGWRRFIGPLKKD